MTVAERFLRYTQFDTQSAEESQCQPSTEGQRVFARFLRDELEREGLTDVVLDDHGYVYATLPANLVSSPSLPHHSTFTPPSLPKIGFIAHIDTSPDAPGGPVKPRIVEHYDGDDITLHEGMALSPTRFPELLAHKGEDLIVTDGNTLLGADDKAGVAEIVQALAWFISHPEVEHGEVRVAFTPDEEIGCGADHFDVERFGCQWAYTMDGGDVGELEYENFNAAAAKLTFRGISVHPGYAKGKMVNASLLAMEFASCLPSDERPETTEGREGFFHITAVSGATAEATLQLIIRDHDSQRFDQRKQLIADIAHRMNDTYGQDTVNLEMKDQYRNMKEVIDRHPHVVETAMKAMDKAGVKPRVQPIRGGTDGVLLSFRGLPCPNIFAGGLNFHGPYEYVSIQSMEKAVEVIIEVVRGS